MSEHLGWLDTLTTVMLVVVTFVSSLVHLYSISYMSGDPHLPRFMSYLSLFTFFMVILVTADNFIQMFLGWEGVGVASYLLINFWFTRLQASKASIKAMLVNRIGDFGLALGIMGVFYLFKTTEFFPVFASAASQAETTLIFCNKEWQGLTTVSILLFIGGVGKSAQLGLHTWLPDAMEGPTPVSALIHAATMVTAGVFMIARCSPLFEYSPTALRVVTIVGGMTCLFAATTGILQNDLKRVIAYSTCSQLGYMVFACGISNYDLGIFHLVNHAFFKALLFLGAGSVIHALSDEQDMRKMGGVVQLLPLTYGMMLIGSFSLAGIPFLTGFYSKDFILEVAFANYKVTSTFACWLGLLCIALTSFYSFRLLILTFLTPTSCQKITVKNCHDATFLLAFPLFLLALGSLFVGYLVREMMVGVATPFWGNSLFILPRNIVLLESEYIPQSQKLLPLFFTCIGGGFAFLITFFQPVQRFATFSRQTMQISFLRYKLYILFNKRWLFDKIYNDFVAQKGLNFGYYTSFKRLDKGGFEVVGPFGIARLFQQLTAHLKRLQSGMIYHYAVVMLLGLTCLITFIPLWEFLEVLVDNRLYFLFLITFLFYSCLSKFK